MTLVTSPNDNSPVIPLPSKEPLVGDIMEDGDSKEDGVDIINNPPTITTTNYDCVPDLSYNPDFMKMDSIYNQNMNMPLTFNYGKEPEKLLTITNTMDVPLRLETVL